MAKNPMQRKAQNSFLLGMLITLLITGIIIAILVVQITKMTKEQQKIEAMQQGVYVVKKDIESGETITLDKLEEVEVSIKGIPKNAFKASVKNEQNKNTNDNKAISIGLPLNLTENSISKINLKKGTILTEDMIKELGETPNDLRKQEYNMIALLSQLQSEDYIDIRLRLPNGSDFIVVSNKKVTIPEIDGIESKDTISLQLTEDEILTLSCAIVENYKIEGSVLYASQYIEPGMQEAAKVTYVPNADIVNLINRDPNCVNEAKDAIYKRYKDSENIVRKPINNGLSTNAEQANENVTNKLEKELQKSREERQKYLESLGGGSN